LQILGYHLNRSCIVLGAKLPMFLQGHSHMLDGKQALDSIGAYKFSRR
jgi:hypothetical protein